MERRSFLASAAAAGTALALPAFGARKRPELRITNIVIQPAAGRRATPVAPNAYAEYRGYDVSEPVLRIRTAQGLEGICRAPGDRNAALQALLGRDPFALFSWSGDRVTGPAPEARDLLKQLGSVDIALFDLMARAIGTPVTTLFGPAVHPSLPIYESSVYMEDLLTSQQLAGIAYLRGKPAPRDVAQLPALKAAWVLATRPEGFKALKIKIGRSRWMPSLDAAIERDVAVTLAVRQAIGPDVKLMVDANKDYGPHPERSIDYARGAKAANLYMIEEMFPEVQTEALQRFREQMRQQGIATKIAAGESYPGGIPDAIFPRRVRTAAGGNEPLLDIDQPDMNANGYLSIRAKAAAERPLGMTLASHNFASRMGFYAMIHLGIATPNWEICEIDDSVYPAFRPEGFVLRNGVVRLTGAPGLGVSLDERHLGKPTIELG